MKIKGIDQLANYMADVGALIVLGALENFEGDELKAKIQELTEEIKNQRISWPDFYDCLGDPYKHYVSLIRNLERR